MSENEQKALRVTRNYMWWSMGAAFIPIPFMDIFTISGLQLKMLADISKIYGIQFQKNQGKAVAGALLGGFFPNMAVGICFNYLDALLGGVLASLTKTVPLVSTVLTAQVAVCSGASAWALGKVFIRHYESGGTLLNFKAEDTKEYFRMQFEEGRKMTSTMKLGNKGEIAV